MSLIKILCFLGLLIPINFIYAASTSRNIIVSKQEEVLLELANEGIIESYHVLAQFYENRSSHRNDFFNKSIFWRIKAAQSGHLGSLYRLGQYGLNFKQYKKKLTNIYINQANNKAWQKEALVLISEAAILGHLYAKIDLVMLPKILAFTYQDINTAFNEALVRLNQDKLINCQFFICKNDLSTLKGNHYARYQNAVSQFHHEKERLKCHRLKRCLELMINNIPTIKKSIITKYQSEFVRENIPKVMKNQRLLAEAESKLTASWEEKADFDRNKQRKLAAQKIVDYHALEDRNKLKENIRELLEKINYHRNTANKIKLSDVMEILSQP